MASDQNTPLTQVVNLGTPPQNNLVPTKLDAPDQGPVYAKFATTSCAAVTDVLPVTPSAPMRTMPVS